MSNPLISVIMSVYNADEDQLFRAVSSILNQTYKNLELIIAIDDMNKKNTKEYLEKTFDDDRLNVYINETNLRLPGSLSNLIKHCNADYIARMDQDDISKPDRLEKELKLLVDDDLDLVAGNIEVIDEENNLMYCFNGEVNETRLYKDFELAHPTWLVKKKTYEDLGLYRNFPHAEDLDFLIRAKLAGKKFGVVEDVVLSYRITTNSMSRSNELKQRYIRKFLLDHAAQNKVADIDEANAYLDSLNLTEKEMKDYSLSRYYYKKSVIAYYQKNTFMRYMYMLMSLAVSKKAREFRFNKVK
ncbi:MAG: glycosyltransferase family 2 protein [Erysipelotrichaceae bacterium]|nr:glycosyltransferase family 2 protein [Erysipelotrichaceae bacterium]